jgi:hypothetical protein
LYQLQNKRQRLPVSQLFDHGAQAIGCDTLTRDARAVHIGRTFPPGTRHTPFALEAAHEGKDRCIS